MNSQELLENFSLKSIKELMSTPPTAEVEGIVKSWLLFKSPEALITVYDMYGVIPPHKHKSCHIGIVLEGSGYWIHSNKVSEIGPMDYINSLQMEPHVLYCKPGGHLLALQVTTPAEGFDEAILLEPGDGDFEQIEALRKEAGLPEFKGSAAAIKEGYYAASST